MYENNICLLTDSYKITHHYFYPKNTERVYSYM
ncbi:MAG: nicotinamide phosphoribosyltransferase domain-containing protein, partial [Methanosphaera sp.]